MTVDTGVECWKAGDPDVTTFLELEVMRLRRISCLLIGLIVFFSCSSLYIIMADEFFDDEPFTQVFSENISVAANGKLPQIEATSAIVMDMKSGRVLYEKNAYTKRAIASTTKIMTAIIALEKGNLEDIVTVSKKAAATGGSTIKLKTGEQLTLKELLYGLMLKSGNDSAVAIAEHIGGSVAGFAEMMTQKAKEIGAVNTQFKTPHGLDTEGHYSTAYDLALIARYALHNPMFSKIVGTVDTTITNRGLHNTNEMLTAYPGADGVKTGFTGQAGRCLVTSATRNEWRIISVVLNCATRTKRAQSSRSILDYAFGNFKQYTLIKESQVINKRLPVIKGMKKDVGIQAVEGITLPLKQQEIDSMETVIELPDRLQTPVGANIEVGSIKFMVDGKVIAQSGLKTIEDARRKGIYDYLRDVIKTWSRLMKTAGT